MDVDDITAGFDLSYDSQIHEHAVLRAPEANSSRPRKNPVLRRRTSW
jgi:hypothetical protein